MKYLNVKVWNEAEYNLEEQERYLNYILSGRIVEDNPDITEYNLPENFELPTSYRIVFVESDNINDDDTFLIMFNGDTKSLKWLLDIDCNYINQGEVWTKWQPIYLYRQYSKCGIWQYYRSCS